MRVFCSRLELVWLRKVCLQLKLSFLYLLPVCHKRKLEYSNHSVKVCGLRSLPLAAKSSVLPYDFLRYLKEPLAGFVPGTISSKRAARANLETLLLQVVAPRVWGPSRFWSPSGFSSHSTGNNTTTVTAAPKTPAGSKRPSYQPQNVSSQQFSKNWPQQ